MKIALFGGAFNPVHNDHIGMAEYLLNNGYDKVVFAPSNNPPHKDCTMDYEERVKMLEQAIGNNSKMVICQLEKTLENINYSYQTIPLYQAIFGNFDFVIGGDSLIDLKKWKYPEKVIELTDIICFNRGNRTQELKEAYDYWTSQGARIKMLDYESHNFSSSRVRLESMLGFVRNVPDTVKEYIVNNNIYYKNDLLDGIVLPSDIAIQMSKELSSFRYEHVLRTALYALYLNKHCNLGLDPNKVLLAGVLHDCAKEDKNFEDEEIPSDCINTPVWHQFAGARKAKLIFYVEDEDVLNAIKYHCTGKADMSLLEKLIFTADMLEPKSLFKDMKVKTKLIEKVENNFEIGFRATLIQSYEHLLEKNAPIYPLTREAVDYYKEN